MKDARESIRHGERALDDAAKVRYLTPEELRFFLSPGGAVCVTVGEERTLLSFSARRCFPLSGASHYVSLRDGAGEEVGIIRDLELMPEQARAWLEEDLERRYYTPQILSIERFRQRWGGAEWEVTTNRGPRKFITRSIYDAVTSPSPSRALVTDIDGNRYEVEVPRLDERSRGILERVL
ncbi:MAG: DUF1854 domain-containing protein [Armatimonadetes bacterium]|nr:DUF1854 domain-containing protein [Armatimonadota bacterium]